MGKVILRVKEIFTRKHVRSVNKRETNYNTVVPNKDHGYTIYGNIQDENINIRNEPQGCIVNEQFNLNPIKQISISEEYKDTNRYEDLNILNLNKPKKRIKKKDILCRICLNEECEDDNPLIYPCKCSGTMRYIHLECLKLWLKTKIVTKTTEHMILQTYKNLSCELCKESIPDKLKVHNEIIYLYDFQKPDSNYLILESMLKESDGTTCLYVIDMKNKDMLKLGRGNDCDVRISDISVSRSHSILRYYDDDFYLTDIQSKFGTLVDIYDIISVIYKCPLGIQIGKVFMQFTLKKTIWSCLKCY